MIHSTPRLGVLALMLEDYESLFPGVTARQEAYVREILGTLSSAADFVFPHAASSRSQIEALTAKYNAEHLDGILIFLLTYAQGQYLVRAMQRNTLPLALAMVQPDETVGDDFQIIEFTVNQGIHGAQDCANCLKRAGIPLTCYAGSRHDEAFLSFVTDFAAAAATRQALQEMRISVIGKLSGMGDVVTDDMAVYRKLGPEFVYDSIGTVQRYCAQITPDQVAARMAEEHTLFDVDPHLPPERHAEAVRMYLGLKQYLQDSGYQGYTAHFEEFAADGRFTRLPFSAASSLMADGYGYAAEGDATTASLMTAMLRLWGHAGFCEMYMMDLARDAILMCHAGEGNWSLCRKDRKPFLMDREFTEGGLADPPTVVFSPEPGPAAVMSLAHLGGERFRLIYASGQVLDKCDLHKIDMPYLFFHPDSGVRTCVTAWLEHGGTHHEVFVPGAPLERVRMLCRMLDIELLCL